jgi:phosphoglycolate phosphatase-like HAD superfamily hydrolase
MRTWAVRRRSLILGATALAAFGATEPAAIAQSGTPVSPLASWNDGPAKQAILNFVHAATDPAEKTFVPIEARIATFDQDGTLWVEHPLYTQGMFALDRIRVMAPHHPEWQRVEPFKTVISGNPSALGSLTEKDWPEIIGVTHAGMTNDAFMDIVSEWLQKAEHPRFRRPYTQLVYQPMLEVMAYLRASGFKTYIVTGGGQEFVRVYAEHVYGIPPEQVIGSSIVNHYQMIGGRPVLMRMPKPFFIDDDDGKAIGINMFIGKRPYAAFGNSNGDRAMLDWTGAGAGARLEMLVHHDDPAREYAYGLAGNLPDTKVGTFSDALMAESKSRGWTVISMKNDWKRIFPFDPA